MVFLVWNWLSLFNHHQFFYIERNTLPFYHPGFYLLIIMLWNTRILVMLSVASIVGLIDFRVNLVRPDLYFIICIAQNENSPIWFHGGNSRTMSTIPANTYYSYQGQNQQLGGFRQGQQSSQNYGTAGHTTFYNSQTGMTLDHKNSSRDSAGSQGQLKQSQIWQSSY